MFCPALSSAQDTQSEQAPAQQSPAPAPTKALAGAQLRVFQTPNVVLTGTIGFATLLRGEHSLYIIGAKPLGSASIVYFFR